MENKRHIVLVRQSYTPKNKLAKEVIETLESFDRTIFPSKEYALKVLFKSFEKVAKEYIKSGGKAMLPSYKDYEFENGVGVHIEDMMIFSILEIRFELLEEDDSINKLMNIIEGE